MPTLVELVATAGGHHRAGRPEPAEELLREAVALEPGCGPALHLLGVLAYESGRHAAARDWFTRAVGAEPSNARYRTCLGAACLALDQTDEAEAHHRKADRLSPGDPVVLNNLGVVLASTSRPADAVTVLSRALSFAPRDPEILCNLGGALHGCGRNEDALRACRDALRLAPGLAHAHLNLGNVLRDLGDLPGAEAGYREAERLRPGWAAARYGMGMVLQGQGRLEDAWASYRSALAADPDDPLAHGALVGTLFYDPTADGPAILAAHRQWAERHAPGPGDTPPYANVPDPDRCLRVGYVSADFRNHAVAFFLHPVLAHHDPRRVAAVCYSGVTKPDARTDEMRRLGRAWRDVTGLTEEELAALVRQDGIDILVDLTGHLAGDRLRAFALRPAPVQVSYLGYPGTTGLEAVAYRLTDAIADPPGAEAGYSEELVRLPGPFCCYMPPAAPEPSEPPSRRQGKVTFGSFHKLEKLNESVIELWCAVLADVPGSRLLLARNTLRGDTARAWVGRFARYGLDPGRIMIEAPEPVDMGHLRLYDRVDVALDPFPWGGHTTACEALWMGVPSVTLLGERYAGRMVASVLRAAGLPDLVAETPTDYRKVAVAVAGDEVRRADLRAGLRARLRGSPLCDAAGFTRALEDAYRTMWQRWCGGRRTAAATRQGSG